MGETDLYGITMKPGNKLEIEPWAKAENMEMVLGQDELWSRRYGVSTEKKHRKDIVLVKIRHGLADKLYQLADYVELNENIRRKYLSCAKS